MTKNTWVVTVEEDADGNSVIPFDKDMLEQLGWIEGDTLDFQMNADESCTIINLSWDERQKSQINTIKEKQNEN